MDTGTALLFATLITSANGVLLGLTLHRFSTELRYSVISWLAGTLFIVAGCIVFIFSRQLPLSFSLPLANGLLLLGLTAYWLSLRLFYQHPSTLTLLLPAIAGTFGIFWFIAFLPNTKVRIMIATVAWLILMGGSLKTLKGQIRDDEGLSRRALMSIFAGVMLFTTLRAVYYGLIDMSSNFDVVDNSSWMNYVTTMMEIVLPIAGTTAFILMCTEHTRQKEKKKLQEQIEQQTKALNKPLKETLDANRRKTETLSYIGHDLRAPLATIVGYAKLLSKTGTPEQAQHIRAIERSANYQLTLIDDILEYAKRELKPLDIRLEPILLTTFLSNVIEHANSLSSQQNNRFEFGASSPLPARVSSDPRRLQQVLLNLISNASKFTRNGLIQLIVRADTTNAATALTFTVSDSGCGIEPQAQTSIFNAFEQAKGQQGSVGLGLYITHRIVKNMGGELQLKSTPNEGSSFTFSIPVELLSTEIATLPSNWSPQTMAAITKASTPIDAPPKEICIELANFARNGQLSDIEDWLQQQPSLHTNYHGFFDEVRAALNKLDFEHIESIALTGANSHPTRFPN